MRRKAVVLGVILWTWAPRASAAPADSFAGDWHPIGAPDDLTRVVIARRGDGFSVQIWSECRPTNCYWGASAAEADARGNSLSAKFTGSDLGAYVTMTAEFVLLTDGSLQVTTRSSLVPQTKKGSLDGTHVAYLAKKDSVSIFLPLPISAPPAEVSKPAAAIPVPKAEEPPAAPLSAAVEPATTDSPPPIVPTAVAAETTVAAGRTWDIPGLSFGPHNWSIVRITNPSATQRSVKLDIYDTSGERFRIKPVFDVQPRETLEVAIEAGKVEIYRGSSQHPDDLKSPRALESSLGSATASEGLTWARIEQTGDDGLPDLDVSAFEEVLYGDTISEFKREPETPFELRDWAIQATEVRGQQIYFLNVSDRPTTVSFCAANKMQQHACAKKESLPTRFLVRPNQCLVLGVKKLPQKYFFVESSNPGPAILAKLVPATGTTEVFHSESSISFGEPAR